MRRVFAAALLIALCACGAPSQAPTSSSSTAPAVTNGIEVKSAWAAPTPGGVTVSAGYLTIVNHDGTADRLIGVTSERANSVDVHQMSMENGVMQMRPAGELLIPPGGSLTLAPGGYHLMFTNPTPPFTLGESVPVTLHFEHGGDVAASLPVRTAAP